MSQCLEPYTHSKNIIKAELNLSIYATKSDLKKSKRWWYIKICSKSWFS